MANWGNSFAQGLSDGWKFGSMYRDRKREEELAEFAKERRTGIGKQDVSERVNAYEAEINRQDDETFGAGTSKELGLPTNDRHFIDPNARPEHVAAGPVYDRRQFYDDMAGKAYGLGMGERGEKYMDRALAEEDRQYNRTRQAAADKRLESMFRLQLRGAEREDARQANIESILSRSRSMYEDIDSGDPNAVMSLAAQAVDYYNSDVTDGRTAKLVMGKNGGFVAEIYDDKTGKRIDSQPLTPNYLKSVVGQWQDYQLRNADVNLGMKLRDRDDKLDQQSWERAFNERGMGLKERALESEDRYRRGMVGVSRAREYTAQDRLIDLAMKAANGDKQAARALEMFGKRDYGQAPAGKAMTPKERLEFEQLLTDQVRMQYPGLKGPALAVKVREEAQRYLGGGQPEADPYAALMAPQAAPAAGEVRGMPTPRAPTQSEAYWEQQAQPHVAAAAALEQAMANTRAQADAAYRSGNKAAGDQLTQQLVRMGQELNKHNEILNRDR